MKLKQQWVSLRAACWRGRNLIVAAGKTIYGGIDFADIVFFSGIAMVGVGVGGRLGLIISGSLLVLSVRPLVNWLKKTDDK